jgi:hypothetical protein
MHLFLAFALTAVAVLLGQTHLSFHAAHAGELLGSLGALGHHGAAGFGGVGFAVMGGLRAANPIVRTSRTRIMPQKTFAPNQTVALELFKDSVYECFSITLSGAVQVTYTGTYTANSLTSFDSLVPLIQVLVNGGRTVKLVRPWLVRMKTYFALGNSNERKASAGAAALTPANPTSDGGWAVGTSTQYTTIRETIDLYFQDILARAGSENLSLLNLAGATSAVMNFSCAAYSAVEAVNQAATGISYANSTLVIDVQTREAQDRVAEKFSDLKETTQAKLFTAASTVLADINRGNFIRGIWVMVRDGDAARSLSNNAVQAVGLFANGFTPLKQYNTFAKIQAENKNYYGINAAQSGGTSAIDGVAYIDLLKAGDPTTALDARGLDNLQLSVTTAASGSGATYTNAVEVTIQTDEYVLPA